MIIRKKLAGSHGSLGFLLLFCATGQPNHQNRGDGHLNMEHAVWRCSPENSQITRTVYWNDSWTSRGGSWFTMTAGHSTHLTCFREHYWKICIPQICVTSSIPVICRITGRYSGYVSLPVYCASKYSLHFQVVSSTKKSMKSQGFKALDGLTT